jgi:hypothetical protein
VNPELLRNLWLEASPFRLVQTAGLLLLVFTVTLSVPRGFISTAGAAVALYWFFAIFWGTRSAALSVVGEIRERTWDGQKLSALGPGELMWGKLLGATSANWFGALPCLLFILAPVWLGAGIGSALVYGVILVSQALFAQAASLLSSLVLIRRNTGNWRLDTFLCQVAGIGAAFTYYSIWSSEAAFEHSGEQALVWWGHVFNVTAFHLVSLLLFLAWALVGCWRAMRAELCLANGPFVWLAYLAYLAIYSAGFESLIPQDLVAQTGASPSTIRLGMAAVALLSSTYSMVFLEPKVPVRLRWLSEQVLAGHFSKAFMTMDAWMLSYAAAIVMGLLLAALLALGGNVSLALPVLAALGFFTRDVALFVLMRELVGQRGDFVAVALILGLYIFPLAIKGLGLGMVALILVPNIASVACLVGAWVQAITVGYLAVTKILKFSGTKPKICSKSID